MLSTIESSLTEGLLSSYFWWTILLRVPFTLSVCDRCSQSVFLLMHMHACHQQLLYNCSSKSAIPKTLLRYKRAQFLLSQCACAWENHYMENVVEIFCFLIPFTSKSNGERFIFNCSYRNDSKGCCSGRPNGMKKNDEPDFSLQINMGHGVFIILIDEVFEGWLTLFYNKKIKAFPMKRFCIP